MDDEEVASGQPETLEFFKVDHVKKKKKKKKKRRGGEEAVPVLRCQAERCEADLMEVKNYHRRHKVCEFHAKAKSVVVAGRNQRFCQQCSKFHEVSEFDEAKRSCRRRLAGHNQRRRRSTIKPPPTPLMLSSSTSTTSSATPPPSSLLLNCSLSSVNHDASNK